MFSTKPSFKFRSSDRRNVSRKFLVFVLAVALAITLTACEPEETTESQSKSNDPISVATSPSSFSDTTSDPASTAPSVSRISGGLVDVVSVIDGDTIKVRIASNTETIRFIGIDTPETRDPRKPVQCFGREASNKMKELVENKQVILESDGSQGDRDRYGRLLRFVFLPDGTNVNLKMIADGYAHEYTYNLPYKYHSQFRQAQREARENNRGLWSPSTCNGDTEQAADGSAAPDNSGSGIVKKSSTGICHGPGTTFYNQTKNFTPYNSIKECLASGGRMPKR